MKTTKTIVILLALVLLTATGAQSDEKPAKKEISNTRTASCLVKITTDEAVLPLNEFVVDYLFHSSGVAGKAFREILDISPDYDFMIFEIEEVFAVDSALGGFGVGMMGGGMMGGGYGGGMGLPADSTPGASGYGSSTTSRSARRMPTSTSGNPTRTPSARTPHPVAATTPTSPKPRIPTSRTPRRKPTVTQPQSSTTEQTILFHLRVDIEDESIKPAAEEFMIALIENLRSALREVFSEYRSKLNEQLHLAVDEADHAERQLVEMQAKLREISGSRDLSRSVILRDISNLRQKLQSAKMKRATDETIYEATVMQIAKEQAMRKKLVENDPITLELRRIVDIQTNSLERINALVKQKTASSAEVEDVREKLARARIELAKRQEEVSNPPGRLAISSTNEELASLATNMALAQQEISSFNEQLKEAEDMLKNADTYEVLLLKADIAKQSLEETLLWLARLGRNNRSIPPPDVTVIGAE
ncbi:MAG: hypothetical protein ACYSUY_09445 [Planctomycetota bacterium]|jgi:hypothetical protein